MGLEILTWLKSIKNTAQLAEVSNITTISHVGNVFTLDMENASSKNFKLISADANAKSIVLDNVDSQDSLITISILIVYATACVITMPVGFTVNGGESLPTPADGQSYWYALESIDGGTSGVIYSLRRT